MIYIQLLILNFFLLFGIRQAMADQADANAYLTETQESKAQPLYEFIPPDYNASAPFKSERHFWVGIFDESLGAIPQLPGMGFNLGVQGKFFGVDFRYISGKTNYQTISVQPDPSVASSFASGNESDELLRTRSPTDPWDFTLYDFGLDFSTHIITQAFSFLSERARMGFVYGQMNDLSNSIPFTAYLISFEVGLRCHFTPQSRLSLDGNVGYEFGQLVSNLHPGPFGILPVSFMTYSLALNYWF